MLTRCSRAVNPVAQILQHLAVSEETYYRWRNQFGGMKAEEAKRLKELELENEGMRGCTDARGIFYFLPKFLSKATPVSTETEELQLHTHQVSTTRTKHPFIALRPFFHTRDSRGSGGFQGSKIEARPKRWMR